MEDQNSKRLYTYNSLDSTEKHVNICVKLRIAVLEGLSVLLKFMK